MHSVVTTFNANMSDNIGAKLDVDVLSAKLTNETMTNSHEYMNYIEFINSDDGTGIPSLRHHVLEYVQHKNYNNLYGDIVPVIVANALMLNILIVEQTGNTYKLHLVKPRHDIGSSILHRTLILHKKNAHYDAIVPSSQSAYVITPPCSARALVSPASPNEDNASIISTTESIACKSIADNVDECNTTNSHVRDDEKRLNDNCIFKEVKQFYLNNKNKFKIAHINVNSVRNKFEPFREVLLENIFDILSIQETKLDDSFPDAQFNVSMYKCYRHDYKCNEGGLMVYVRNDMIQRRRHDIEKCAFNNCDGRIEILSVEVSINKETWLFISMYKQPKVRTMLLIDCLEAVTNEFALDNCNIVILGDLNVNMLKSNVLSDWLDISGLTNVIKEPTCRKGLPSLLDVLITNKPKRLQYSSSIDIGLSDFHNLVCAGTKFHVSKRKRTKIFYRSYKKFDETMVLHALSVAPFHVSEIFDDVDDAYWMCSTLLQEIVNEHAPIKQKTIKGNHLPYMNGELRRAINVKRMLKRKFTKCNSNMNWDKYRKQRNIVTKLLKKSLQQYMQKKCNEAVNGGDFWKTFKPLISNRGINKDDNIFLSYDGEIVNNTNDICRIFNNYFTHIANSIGVDDTIYQDDTCESCISDHDNHRSICQIRNLMNLAHTGETQFSFENVDVAVIRKHLKNININKATGHDLLPPKLLKLGSHILCYPLCFILNMCFTSGMFPDTLKQAEICPIFKKGDAMNVCNYRPVSILPIVSKIFEKEMVRQLENYFEDILSPYISGFRKTHSCETVLIRMVEHIKKSLDHGKIVCAILMDLSKAFDCISHKLLIAKFRSYGLSMSACHLLTSYLRDRTQRVKLGNTKSKWLHINKGSAQGSILGPFCYNVFTNDMLSIVSDNIEIYNYADDNTVICSGYEYEDIKAELMLNVDKIIDWFRDNHMKVNPDKCQCIVFGNVVNPGTFIINGNVVRPEETVKLLGVHIDNKLDFGHHVSHICQKAGKQVKVLSRLSRVLNESNKLLLYSSFISCYFNYCCVLWHFCNNSDTLKIEKLQEKALRYSMLDFKSPYQQLLHNCGKSTLFLQRLQKLMEVIYRILNGLYPSYLNDIITVEELQHLRCRSRLFIPPFSTVRYGKKSLSYLSPVLWNSLGNDIKQCDVLTAFKKRIKLWKGPICNCGFCAQCRISNRLS